MSRKFSGVSNKNKISPENIRTASLEFEKKPAVIIFAVILLFNFFLTLSYTLTNADDMISYFKALPIFGFSLITQGLLAATLIVMFLGARLFSSSQQLAKIKDILLFSTVGIAASEAIFYVAFVRKKFISCGYTPRHSAFLSIVEVLGLAAVLVSLVYSAGTPKALLYSIILCPFACLLRLIPSFVYVRDFMQAKLELLDMSKDDFLTPFFESLNDPLFHLQLIKILCCLLLAGFAGSVYYHFMDAKKQKNDSEE